MRNIDATVDSARNRPADRRADTRSDKLPGSIANQASANGLGRVLNTSNTLHTNPSHAKRGMCFTTRTFALMRPVTS